MIPENVLRQLQKMEEPERSLAIHYFNEDFYNKNFYYTDTPTISQCINAAFSWDSTDEGDDYWEGILGKYYGYNETLNFYHKYLIA